MWGVISMDKTEKDFRWLYQMMCGYVDAEYPYDWVDNAFVEGTVFSRAYEDFWTARENLCRRYGMDWEVVELERFMNGIMALTEDVARRMFYIGIRYSTIPEEEKM